MNYLPIRLERRTVTLNNGREAERWTLGPTWFDHYQDTDDFTPWAGDAAGPITPIMMNWAESAIARTTDYRVVGWDGAVPSLQLVVNRVEISVYDAIYARNVSCDVLRAISRVLTDPDAVVTLNEDPDHQGETCWIPVRAISGVRNTETRHPVAND